MAKTFMQMADEAMAQAHAISAEEARKELEQDSNVLLVDVRDESEVQITGLGIGALNAPGRSLAWKADLEFDEKWRDETLTRLDSLGIPVSNEEFLAEGQECGRGIVATAIWRTRHARQFPGRGGHQSELRPEPD